MSGSYHCYFFNVPCTIKNVFSSPMTPGGEQLARFLALGSDGMSKGAEQANTWSLLEIGFQPNSNSKRVSSLLEIVGLTLLRCATWNSASPQIMGLSSESRSMHKFLSEVFDYIILTSWQVSMSTQMIMFEQYPFVEDMIKLARTLLLALHGNVSKLLQMSFPANLWIISDSLVLLKFDLWHRPLRTWAFPQWMELYTWIFQFSMAVLVQSLWSVLYDIHHMLLVSQL